MCYGQFANFFGNGFFHGIGGIVMWILFAIILTVLTVFLFKYLKIGKTEGINSSLEILNKKYANGEISKEEFLEKKHEIF